MRRMNTSLIVLVLVTASPGASLGQWSTSPDVSLPVCTAAGTQSLPKVVSDGAGGAIVAWQDERNGAHDIYAQRVLASGLVDPAWPVDGRALCTAASYQFNAAIVSDGAGGAIVTWQDERNGPGSDIYAQHVLATGVVDPAWPTDGRALCTAGNTQAFAMIVSDGAGGAVVAWQDSRSGEHDIYAQHVLASGVVDPAWPTDGRAVCIATGEQYLPAMAPDGVGGAIVVWQDARSYTGWLNLYAQRVLASGAVDPAWPGDGQALSRGVFSYFQGLAPENLAIIPDGAGGAIVTWLDQRSGGPKLYAQHVLISGVMDASWPVNGRALCPGVGSQNRPAISSDGSGGAIVAWIDSRSGTSPDVYAQRVSTSGTIDPAWPASGLGICRAGGSQERAAVVSNGADGAIVIWLDSRGGRSAIFSHRVSGSGMIDPAWSSNGNVVSSSAAENAAPALVRDEVGGAIVVWADAGDIHAQRVSGDGAFGNPDPTIRSVNDVPNDQGGRLKLTWPAIFPEDWPGNPVDRYWILRSVPEAAALRSLASGARIAASPGDVADQPQLSLLRTRTGEANYY